MESHQFYVYCHRRKTDGKCFYIGKGSGKRYKAKESRNPHWWNIVNKHGFETEILVNNITELKAFELEAEFCKQIGYENLCNIREENGWGGYTQSDETKEKHRLNGLGKKASPETIEKQRQKRLGSKRSEETKKKMSESAKKRFAK